MHVIYVQLLFPHALSRVCSRYLLTIASLFVFIWNLESDAAESATTILFRHIHPVFAAFRIVALNGTILPTAVYPIDLA